MLSMEKICEMQRVGQLVCRCREIRQSRRGQLAQMKGLLARHFDPLNAISSQKPLKKIRDDLAIVRRAVRCTSCQYVWLHKGGPTGPPDSVFRDKA
jgi:hypothetical protein